MYFLERYYNFYLNEYPKWEYENQGVVIVMISTLLTLKLGGSVWIGIIIGTILAYWSLRYYEQSMFISPSKKTLLIVNNSRAKNRSNYPQSLLPTKLMTMIGRVLGLNNDKKFIDTKILAGEILNRGANRVYLHVYDPEPQIPLSQIIITNHVDSPIRDAFSFFPFIRRESEVLIVQHDFNKFISYVSRYVYGAWTIDKDDKSAGGKQKLVEGLSNIVAYVNKVRKQRPITLVVYPMGKVPKTEEQVRNPTKFYPGAFYLSLLLDLPVTPLVNYYSPTGGHHIYLLPARDLTSEFGNQVNYRKFIGDFRNDEMNKPVLEKICESFRKQFQEVYNKKWKTSSEDLGLDTDIDFRNRVTDVEENLIDRLSNV